MAKSKNRNVTIEWCDVKAAFTAAVEDGTTIGNQPKQQDSHLEQRAYAV